jgi:hypothetical protein
MQDEHVRDPFLQTVKYVFKLRSREEALEQIIRFYARMAKSTLAILSTCVSPEDWGMMKTSILKGRQMYQKICEAAAVAVQREDNRGLRSVSPAISETSTISGMGHQDEVASHAEFEENFEVAGHTHTKKAKEFRKFAAQPNYHQGVHLADLPREYATAYNVYVLQGEDEHK